MSSINYSEPVGGPSITETLERLAPGTPILDCVRAEATLGEIADRLRRVWGEHAEGF